MRGEDERQILERNGYPEEVYFTYSHSPIIDVDGAVVGMFTVSTETTAKVVDERRMRVVRELGALSATEAGSTGGHLPGGVGGAAQRPGRAMPFAVAFLRERTAGVGPTRVADVRAGGPDAAMPGRSPTADGLTGMPGRRSSTGCCATGRDRGSSPGCATALPARSCRGRSGRWTPDAAVVLPLTVSGRADPIGVLVVGVNPYRPLDEEYRAFFTLIGRQVGSR